MSSIGNTCEYPPPVAPPFIPKTGPNEGSRKTTVVCLPILLSPSDNPIEMVVFPSPAGVGEIADTRIKLLSAALFSSSKLSGSLALYLP